MSAISDPVAFLQNLGLPQILIWLLTFALINGILGAVNVPKSKVARAIIAISLAFLVIMSAPDTLFTFLTQMSAGLVLAILGLLVILVFLEAGGIKLHEHLVVRDEKGNPKADPQRPGKPLMETKEVSIFQKFGKVFAVGFGIIAIMIFVSAGGLQLLGIQNIPFNVSDPNMVTMGFFVVIIIGLIWMIANPDDGK